MSAPGNCGFDGGPLPRRNPAVASQYDRRAHVRLPASNVTAVFDPMCPWMGVTFSAWPFKTVAIKPEDWPALIAYLSENAPTEEPRRG